MFQTPFKIACLLAASLVFTGCPNIPDTYAPPAQRKPADTGKMFERKTVIAMNDPHAHLYFLRDIQFDLHQETWRWTGKNPALALGHPADKNGLRLVVDLATTGETLKDTGPVTIRFILNGHELGREQYDKAGTFQFTAPVPPDLVRMKVDNELAMEIDKTWSSAKQPGPYGFILVRAGLVR